MDRLEFEQLEFDEISTLTLDDLGQPVVAEKIHNTILILDQAKEPGVALNLFKKLNELLGLAEKNKADGVKINLKEYQNDITLLKFISLIGLTDKEIEELFRTNLVFAIRSDIMVLDQVRHYIATYFNPVVCSKFADIIIKAISYNEESLGDNQIFLETEKKPTAPQLKNWVRSYNQSFDSSLRNVILQEGEYLSTNKDVLKLSIDERKILEQIIKVYDFLRFPDQLSDKIIDAKTLPTEPIRIITADNLLEEKELSTLKIEKARDQISEEILQAYQGDSKQVKAITKEQQKIIKKFGEDITKLRAEFFKTVQKKNVNRTIALLRYLAELGDLENFLKEDARLNKFLLAIWEKQYSPEFVAEFSQNPAQLKFVRQFLRYVLEQRLGLESSDAARVGLQIGNIFVNLGKKDYNKMAYFDVKTRSFSWFE